MCLDGRGDVAPWKLRHSLSLWLANFRKLRFNDYDLSSTVQTQFIGEKIRSNKRKFIFRSSLTSRFCNFFPLVRKFSSRLDVEIETRCCCLFSFLFSFFRKLIELVGSFKRKSDAVCSFDVRAATSRFTACYRGFFFFFFIISWKSQSSFDYSTWLFHLVLLRCYLELLDLSALYFGITRLKTRIVLSRIISINSYVTSREASFYDALATINYQQHARH